MLGAQQGLACHGYYLLVSMLEAGQVNDLANLRLLRERRVDSVILAGPEIAPRPVPALRAKRMPFVLVDNALPHNAVNCVLSEDERGGHGATDHLLEDGHQRIAMLGGLPD